MTKRQRQAFQKAEQSQKTKLAASKKLMQKKALLSKKKHWNVFCLIKVAIKSLLALQKWKTIIYFWIQQLGNAAQTARAPSQDHR